MRLPPLNDEGMIDEICVMVRPATGLMALAEAMKRQLESGDLNPRTHP